MNRLEARKLRLSEKPSEELAIAVTFPPPHGGPGPTEYGVPLSREVTRRLMPESPTVERGLQVLRRHGFEATTRGRLTVSVRGSRQDFEKTFGTTLSRFVVRADDRLPADEVAAERKTSGSKKSIRRRPSRSARSLAERGRVRGRLSASAVFYPPPDAPWKPDPEVQELIDDAYIQWPHVYLNQRFAPPIPSPLPPLVDYHHLRVPGDVTLLMNVDKVHRQGTTGKGVRVAMIDSGFAHGHPYFQERGYNTSVVLAATATHKDEDGNGHGTGESANLLAIAPDVTFVGIKLDNENDPRNGASVLEGFQEALAHNPRVISVSLGYDLCPTNPVTGRRTSNLHLTTLPNGLRALEAEIEAAVADGIVVVFSAGNGHVSFPGMMPDLVSAGGVFVDDQGGMLASDYASAFDSKIYPGRSVPDVCGLVGMSNNRADYIVLPIPPGCEIDVDNSAHDHTQPGDGWGVFSGTSAAAPQLAGVCALLLEKNPGLTPDDVKAVLRRTCRDVVNGSANPASNENQGGKRAAAGIDGATGAGLVDAFAAWQQV